MSLTDLITVQSARCTCSSVPEQWEGQLADGRYFYFRYRFSRVSLAIGDVERDVWGVTHPGQVPGVSADFMALGDGKFASNFEDDLQRRQVFLELLSRILLSEKMRPHAGKDCPRGPIGHRECFPMHVKCDGTCGNKDPHDSHLACEDCGGPMWKCRRPVGSKCSVVGEGEGL